MPKQQKKLGRARARKRRKKQKKRQGPPSAIFLVVLLIVSSVVFLKYDVVSLGMNRIIKTGNMKELRSGLYTLKNRILNFQIGRDKATKQPASFVHAYSEHAIDSFLRISDNLDFYRQFSNYNESVCNTMSVELSRRESDYRMPKDKAGDLAIIVLFGQRATASGLSKSLKSLKSAMVNSKSVPVYISFSRHEHGGAGREKIMKVLLQYRKEMGWLSFICHDITGTEQSRSAKHLLWSTNHIFNGGARYVLTIGAGEAVLPDLVEVCQKLFEYSTAQCSTCFGAFVGDVPTVNTQVSETNGLHVVRMEGFSGAGVGGVIFYKTEWVVLKSLVDLFCRVAADWNVVLNQLAQKGLIKPHVLALTKHPRVKTVLGGEERSTSFKIVDHGISTSGLSLPNALRTRPAAEINSCKLIIPPSIAILLGVTSRGFAADHKHFLKDTSLVETLLPSIQKSLEQQYDYIVYIAIDRDDMFWTSSTRVQRIANNYIKLPNIFLRPIVVRGGTFVKAINEIASIAFADGNEYFCRINDDSEFLSYGWTSEAIRALARFKPRNVGVVGPVCKDGNTRILTHDFVHRQHMMIFKDYYPADFENAWIDDWITDVYSNRMARIKRWTIRHHTGKHGTRYSTHGKPHKMLPLLVRQGQQTINQYVEHVGGTNSDTSRHHKSQFLHNFRNGKIVEVISVGNHFNLSYFMKNTMGWHCLQIELDAYFMKLEATPIDPLVHHFTAPVCNGTDTKTYTGSKGNKIRSKCRKLQVIVNDELFHPVDTIVINDIEESGASVVNDILSTWDFSGANKNNNNIVWMVHSNVHSGEINKFFLSRGLVQYSRQIEWAEKYTNRFRVYHQKIDVITFSLQYQEGFNPEKVLTNVDNLMKLYPNFVMRAYYDSSILGHLIHMLEHKGVKMHDMTGHKRYTSSQDWPLKTMLDPIVNTFVVCDIENMNDDEVGSIDEWLSGNGKTKYIFFTPLSANRWGIKNRIGYKRYDTDIVPVLKSWRNTEGIALRWKQDTHLAGEIYNIVEKSSSILV